MDKKKWDKSLLATVIIPTFNRKKWIGDCLDSVLAQTYPNIEVIVVDDCSTDGTVDWLSEQPRFQKVNVHQQTQNGGASIARNTAIGLASGDLIVFIDSDDLLMPNHVEVAARFFEENPDLGLFCCDSKMIGPEGNVILDGKTWHQNLSEIKNLEIKTGFRSLEDVFRYSNCFPGFTLRRAVFQELGGFDQSLFPADDYDLALRVAGTNFRVFYLHEPLCLRREHDGQCSGVYNSEKTQNQLILALEQSVQRNPDELSNKSRIRNRMAELKLELAISKLKEGKRSEGMKTLVRSILIGPRQIGTLARLGGRRFKRAAGL